MTVKTATKRSTNPALKVLLKALQLPAMAASFGDFAEIARDQDWSFEDYLRELAEQEINGKRQRRIERHLKESKLPREKTFATFDRSRLPSAVRKKLPELCKGHFLDRCENILAFGLPGRGKTHLLCALCHELIQQDRRVYYCSTAKLVERLLTAKRDLSLERELQKLDRFEAILLDDLGYVQQSREEMEVLFTFLSERYERRSVLITSNLVFSQWERIFKDPMTTAAAIDRLVHHSQILELTGSSYRTKKAKEREGKGGKEAPSGPTKNHEEEHE